MVLGIEKVYAVNAKRGKVHRKLKSIIGLTLCMLVISLTGCIPDHVNKSLEKQIEDTGVAMIKEYLDSKGTEYEITQTYVVNGPLLGQSPYTGSYVTDFVMAYYNADGERHRMYANTKSGELYDDLLWEDLTAFAGAELSTVFADAGHEQEVLLNAIEVEYQYVSHDIPGKMSNTLQDIDTRYSNVLPVAMTVSDIPDYVKGGFGGGTVQTLSVCYSVAYGEEFPRQVLEDFMKDCPGYEDGLPIVTVYNLSKEDFAQVQAGEGKAWNYPFVERWTSSRLDGRDIVWSYDDGRAEDGES